MSRSWVISEYEVKMSTCYRCNEEGHFARLVRVFFVPLLYIHICCVEEYV